MKRKLSRTYRLAKYIMYRETLITPVDHLWTFIGAFFGIGIIGFIQNQQISYLDNVFLIGSFGASAVLIFGSPNIPLAQPRNLIGGHLISALIGVSIHKLISLPDYMWLASALSVALAIIAMQITKTMHPPGGATALIANVGSQKIFNMGFGYVLSPVLTGVIILFSVAVIVNNIPKGRSYPVRRKN